MPSRVSWGSLVFAFVLGAGSASAQPKKADPHAKKPAAAKPGAKGKKPASPRDTKPMPAHVDEGARHRIAGPQPEEKPIPVEVPELTQLRAIERELFPEGAPPLGIDPPLDLAGLHPAVFASGVPPTVATPLRPAIDDERLDWMQSLALPDIPVRWDARVIRFLKFFRDDPRGRSMVATGFRRLGKYGDVIRPALRAEGAPEALVWLAMVESAFDPSVKSHAGAAGMFQFMPDGGRIYGLRVDRLADDRLDPLKASGAAAKYLADLKKRFGTWELALAAYNMGFGALLTSMRKYNTNDYWELARVEAGIPWETTLYVPKIVALAIVEKNPAVFGLDKVTPEPPLAVDNVKVKGGASLDVVARAGQLALADVAALNPQLRAGRAPLAPHGPDALGEVEIHVPKGKGEAVRANLAALVAQEPPLAEYTVRFGQGVDSIATELGASRAKIYELNAMAPGDALKPGETILVPGDGRAKLAGRPADPTVVVVPSGIATPAGLRRVFYRARSGDQLRDVATAFRVAEGDLRGWNAIDPDARLQEGMTLQVFVPEGQDLSGVVAIREAEAKILVAGTPDFFKWFEAQKGRRRVEIVTAEKDSWDSIARKYGCSVALLERINRRPRSTALRPGDVVVVYTGKPDDDDGPSLAGANANAPVPTSDPVTR